MPEGAKLISPIAAPLQEADHQMEVFYGEAITSLRQLFRRYTLSKTWVSPTPTASNIRLQHYVFSALPYAYGYDPNGIEVENTFPATFTTVSPLTWMMPCYAGWRGGLRKKYLFDGNVGSNPVITRAGYQAFSDTGSVLPLSGPAFLQKRLGNLWAEHTFNGAATTHLLQNGALEVEIPYYNGVRFSPSRMPSADFNNGAESLDLEFMSFPTGVRETGGQSAFISDWSAAGEDFSMFFFTGCPVMYKYKMTGT
jgi:hypothetical protein